MSALMVTGAYYVQRVEFAGQACGCRSPVGVLVALILLANNIRDIQFDAAWGSYPGDAAGEFLGGEVL